MDFLSYQSVPAILKVNAKRFAKKTAVSFKKQGVFLSLTFEEFYERVLMLARGLVKVGLQPGDPVCIFSENRLGWAISDFGIQSARGIPVPIYAPIPGNRQHISSTIARPRSFLSRPGRSTKNCWKSATRSPGLSWSSLMSALSATAHFRFTPNINSPRPGNRCSKRRSNGLKR